jgi:hypothetical protein
VVFEELDAFGEGEFDCGYFALEGCEFELFVDGFQLSSVSLFEVVEDEGEELSEEV